MNRFVQHEQESWVKRHPDMAFLKAKKMVNKGEKLILRGATTQASLCLGEAYETCHIIFEQNIISPELLTTMTSLAISLGYTYASLGKIDDGNVLLQQLNYKLNQAVKRESASLTQEAFYHHCMCALKEARREMNELYTEYGQYRALH